MENMEETGNFEGARRQTPSDLAKSTDPLILDVRQVPSGIQSNKSERAKRENEAVIVDQDKQQTVEEIPKISVEIEGPQRQRSLSRTYDGVFANLSAKPEVMVLPKGAPSNEDAPPAYTDSRMMGQPRFMAADDFNMADCVDDVFLDDYEVGSALAFLLCVASVILFQFWGFIFTFIMSQSHASRQGSLAGLGLLVAFSSISLQADIEQAVRPALQAWVPLFCLAVGLSGYLLFLYMLISYQRIRRIAESMIRVPGNQAPGVASFV